MPQYADMMMMLEAREKRAARQQKLLGQYHLPIISFSMNIAGPFKNSPLIARAFRLGRDTLLERLEENKAAVVFSEEISEVTGCEGVYVVDAEADHLKEITCAVEEAAPVGRLYDMDVLTEDGGKLDRPVPRRCLICGNPAKICARSRAHTVEELQQVTQALLSKTFDRADADFGAFLAVRSLLYEVCVTPKPGLVDRVNNGSHRDMDIYSFLSSAPALQPYFRTCVAVGRETAALPAPETLKALRRPGKKAEKTMFRATGGVNTHKGAIYSMGILCGALGRLAREEWTSPERILEEAGRMAAGTVAAELGGLTPESARTSGERFFLQYGISGIRGEAEAGFPSVRDAGLPVLERFLAEGRSNDEAGAAALLAILASTPDTNIIARGGIGAYRRVTAELQKILEKTALPEREELEELDRVYTEENLSPGGSADLLALCWMLHFLRQSGEG